MAAVAKTRDATARIDKRVFIILGFLLFLSLRSARRSAEDRRHRRHRFVTAPSTGSTVGRFYLPLVDFSWIAFSCAQTIAPWTAQSSLSPYGSQAPTSKNSPLNF